MIVNLSRLGKSGTGMWQYSIKFLTALREIADVDAIICSKAHADYFEKLGYAVVTVPNIVSNTSKTSRLRPLVWYVYSYWLALRVLIKFGNKKLVCTTHHTIPLLRNQTITIHDIRPFYYPDSLIQKVYFRFLLKMSVKRCKHVLTVSYTVKDSIAKTYNVDSENIVSGNLSSNSVSKSDFIYAKKEKENYFLAVGASWPHKNIHSFIKNKKVWSDSYNLIIVCGRTDYAMSLQQMLSKSIVKSKADIEKFGIKTVFMSNSFAAYRRSVFEELSGFPEHTILAEDMFMAAKMIQAGYKVAYCAEAVVRHSHNYTPREEFQRYFDTGVFHACSPWIQRDLGGAGGEGFRFVKSEIQFLLKNAPFWIPRALLTTFAKFLGYKLGKHWQSLPLSTCRYFSMYKSYWNNIQYSSSKEIK